MCELCTNTNGYAHAVLARDGASVLRVVDEGHVDSDQWRPVRGQHLTANYGHQAAERQRERRRVNITNCKNIFLTWGKVRIPTKLCIQKIKTLSN